jgi:DNA polymerase III delta prime subunit
MNLIDASSSNASAKTLDYQSKKKEFFQNVQRTRPSRLVTRAMHPSVDNFKPATTLTVKDMGLSDLSEEDY